jgi:hypothetical protein
MAFSLQTLAESALLVAPATVVSAYIGARIQSYVDRPRVSASILTCRLPKGEELDSYKIEVDDELSRMLKESTWFPTLQGAVSAKEVADCIDRGDQVIELSRKALPFLKKQIDKLPQVDAADNSEKLHFLREVFMGEYNINIDVSQTGGLERRDFTLAAPSDDGMRKEPLCRYYENTDEKGGFTLYIGPGIYPFYSQYKVPNEFLLPAVKAISSFDSGCIRQMLLYVKEDLNSLLAEGDAILDRLKHLVAPSQHFIVEVVIENRGKMPAFISQWGILNIIAKDTGKFPLLAMERSVTDILENATSIPRKGGRLSLSGGSSEFAIYTSIYTLGELAKECPSLLNVFELDMFKCKFGLRHVDKPSGRRSSWVWSSIGTFGKSGEDFPNSDLSLFR